jgi:uncharacterized LabA/DUF88 family protein
MPNNVSADLAVLIDAENAQAAVIAQILSEVAKYGTATIRRAYGDWTTPNLGRWKETLHVHAVQPIQQFRYTTGKNATDSALIIDAMDILHGGKVDGFAIVSSDSDFTRLATRIREAGLAVYGFGEKKTPQPFVAACDKFIYTEILDKADGKAKPKPKSDPKLVAELKTAVTAAAQEDGWAFLGAVGSYLNKNDPAFDSRNYGYKKLRDLVHAQSCLEIDERRADPDSPIFQIYVRRKDA